VNAAPSTRAVRCCPRCCSTRVRRSHRRHTLDYVLSALGGRIRRCHDCRARQVWFGALAIPLETPCALTHAAVIGAGFLLCLLVVWWTIRHFRELSG
jgi:hypothetical protein